MKIVIRLRDTWLKREHSLYMQRASGTRQWGRMEDSLPSGCSETQAAVISR